MALPKFAKSASLSLGVELELQLIDPRGHDLTPRVDDLLRAVELAGEPGEVKHEITQSMVEISTTVHANHHALRAAPRHPRLHGRRNEAVGIEIAGGGTHPFQRWRDRVISEKPQVCREVASILHDNDATSLRVSFGEHQSLSQIVVASVRRWAAH